MIDKYESESLRYGNYKLKIKSMLKYIFQTHQSIQNEIRNNTESQENDLKRNLTESYSDIEKEIKDFLLNLKIAKNVDLYINELVNQLCSLKNINVIQYIIQFIFEKLPEPITNETFDKYAIKWNRIEVFKIIYDENNLMKKSNLISLFHFIYHAILNNDELKIEIESYFDDE